MFRSALLIVLLVLATTAASAADFKPIVPTEGYRHDRWQTIPADWTQTFAAYVTSFDTADDNNGDGTPDIWAVPEWVAYELRAFEGKVPKYGRPSTWITVDTLFSQQVALHDASYLHSGYSRDRLCMKTHASRIGEAADYNTHTVLNAVPQIQTHNNGIWKKLEK